MLAANVKVPEQVKHFDTLFGSHVKQFDDIIHGTHFDGLLIS
jgi:hypothetical protein